MLTSDEIEDTIQLAHECLKPSEVDLHDDRPLAHDLAEALIQVIDRCVIGLPCSKHYDAVHGREAEELRKGLQKILAEHEAFYDDDDDRSVREDFKRFRKALIRLLDEVDARDSLAFLEHTDGKGAA